MPSLARPLHTPAPGALILKAVLAYARKTGNPALRKMTFPERGRMLRALALYLKERVEPLYKISYLTGATRPTAG